MAPGASTTWQNVFQAIKRNDLTAVKNFFEKDGGTITVTDFSKRSVALVAVQYGHLPILKYVLEKNNTLLKVPDQAGNTVLEQAIQKGNLEMVKYLVEDQKADILIAEHHINTAVHVAAQEGQLPILKYFVEEKNADVNVKNQNGETPLFSAAEKPFPYVVMYLIEERHADPTVTDLTSDNILFKSAHRGDLIVPRYLLDVKKIHFDINWRNAKGYTVVNWASRFNHTEFVKYMVEQKKADVTIPDVTKCRTPLHHAAIKNNRPLCQFLVEHGAKVETKDTRDLTASQLTSEHELADYLQAQMPTEKSGRRRRDVTGDESIITYRPVSLEKMVASNSYQSVDLLRAYDKQAAIGDITNGTGTTLGALGGFLMVVDTVVRYAFKDSTYQQETYRVMSSPQEVLQRRMSMAAIDAVHQPSNYE